MANSPGKRLKCAQCGGEVIVTTGGEGTVTCCSQPMGA